MRVQLPTAEVTAIREEIARLDRSLLLMLAAREDAVRRLFEAKARLGLPLVDRIQEAVVVSRARRWARALGIPPDGVAAVFRRIIAAGKEAAESGAPPIDRRSPVVTVLVAPPRTAEPAHVGGPIPAVTPSPASSTA
jgi:chorismate mutase